MEPMDVEMQDKENDNDAGHQLPKRNYKGYTYVHVLVNDPPDAHTHTYQKEEKSQKEFGLLL